MFKIFLLSNHPVTCRLTRQLIKSVPKKPLDLNLTERHFDETLYFVFVVCTDVFCLNLAVEKPKPPSNEGKSSNR